MDLMWDKGYNATSVNDIVKAAGIPKGSFYFYFDSKEDFAIKALREYFAEVYGPFSQKLIESGKSPILRIKEFYYGRMETLIKEMSDNRGCFACNLSSEVADHIDGIQEEVAKIHNRVLSELVQVGKEAQDAGELAPELDVEKMFAFLEDAGKGAMVSMKALGNHTPIQNFRYMLDQLLS